MPPLYALLLLLAATPVHGASALRLSPSAEFGTTAAVVYDAQGRPVGEASLRVRQGEGGRVVFAVETRVPGEGASELYAELEPDPRGGLVPVLQRTRTLDARGALVVGMRVDHRAGKAFCVGEDGRERLLELAPEDRIANVPVSLLLAPLARGDAEQVRFDLLLCRGEPRLLETVAKVEERTEIDGVPVAVLNYRFELGPVLSWLAGPFLPEIRFWLSGGESGAWLGHRMPLYPKGPEFLVLRAPLAPSQLLP